MRSPKNVFEAKDIPCLDPVTINSIPTKAKPMPRVLYLVSFSSVNRCDNTATQTGMVPSMTAAFAE